MGPLLSSRNIMSYTCSFMYMHSYINLIISYLLRLDWIELFRSRFTLNDFVVCGFQGNDMPKFGKICDLIQIEQQLFFCVQDYTTKGTDYHYQTYVLETSVSHTLVNIDESSKLLNMLHPLCSHVIEPSTDIVHVVSKYILLNT